jgi:hypothetical protein
MDAREFAATQIANQERNLRRIMDTLTQEEIAWRPASACNSIGLLLYHIARSEDSFMLPTLTGQKAVWETERWCDRLGMPMTESGGQYSAEQVNTFVPPPLKELVAYSLKVHSKVLSHIRAMGPDEFDRKITVPYFGEMTVAGFVALMIDHSSQHIGEMSYLRGLQRGLNK